MGRLSKALYLTPEQRLVLDRVIRMHSYCNLDSMVAELTPKGITISRSALHRWASKLQKSDHPYAGTPDDTVVVIMERKSGITKTVTTVASGDAVFAAIEALSHPD